MSKKTKELVQHYEKDVAFIRDSSKASLSRETEVGAIQVGFSPYLEDHPSGCKWLITMVSLVSPLSGVMGPLLNGRTSWLINGGY